MCNNFITAGNSEYSELIVVPIEGNNTINPSFIKANGFLIEKYVKKFKDQDLKSKKQILTALWKSEFNIDLISEYDNNSWTQMQFANASEKMLFLLKWK
jgi:hypothetical protein